MKEKKIDSSSSGSSSESSGSNPSPSKKENPIQNKPTISANNLSNKIREKFFDKVKIYKDPINIKEKNREEEEKSCDRMLEEKFIKKTLLLIKPNLLISLIKYNEKLKKLNKQKKNTINNKKT